MRGTSRHRALSLLKQPACWLRAGFILSTITAFWATPLAAQIGDDPHGSRYGYDFHNAVPNFPDDRVKGPENTAFTIATGDESCFMSPLTGMRSPTAGVASLQVPTQSRKVFQSACGAARHNKLEKAEDQLRKALHEDAQYPAAWVLLGQVLKGEQKSDDARNACSQALKIDPGYVAANLCLADLCAVGQRWDEMLRFANSAIALDPANNPQAYFYAAGAYLGLRRLAEAEQRQRPERSGDSQEVPGRSRGKSQVNQLRNTR